MGKRSATHDTWHMTSASLGQSWRVCISTLCVSLRFSVSIRKNVPVFCWMTHLSLSQSMGNTACIPSARSSVVLDSSLSLSLFLYCRKKERKKERIPCTRECACLSRRRTEKQRNEFVLVVRIPALLKAASWCVDGERLSKAFLLFFLLWIQFNCQFNCQFNWIQFKKN